MEFDIFLYFEAREPPPKLYEPFVFCFERTDELIEACVRVFSLFGHRIFKSSLYNGGGRWLLSVIPLDGPESPAVSMLSEYGRRLAKGRFAAAAAAEHHKPVIADNAVDLIARYFG